MFCFHRPIFLKWISIGSHRPSFRLVVIAGCASLPTRGGRTLRNFNHETFILLPQRRNLVIEFLNFSRLLVAQIKQSSHDFLQFLYSHRPQTQNAPRTNNFFFLFTIKKIPKKKKICLQWCIWFVGRKCYIHMHHCVIFENLVELWTLVWKSLVSSSIWTHDYLI